MVTVGPLSCAEDGSYYENGASWDITPNPGYAGSYSGNYYHFAGRFDPVNVAQGVTINAGTEITVNVEAQGGTNISCEIYGEDVDDSAAFTGRAPTGWTLTTDSDTFPANPGTGVATVACVTAVQEVVNRAGWAANQSMSLIIWSPDPGGTDYAQIEGLDGAGTDEMTLTIVHSEGGSVAPLAVHHMNQMRA